MHFENCEFSAKATGEALSAVLAEIAVRSSGDPLIELLTFWFPAPQGLANRSHSLPSRIDATPKREVVEWRNSLARRFGAARVRENLN
jgi:hypothetical protein